MVGGHQLIHVPSCVDSTASLVWEAVNKVIVTKNHQTKLDGYNGHTLKISRIVMFIQRMEII